MSSTERISSSPTIQPKRRVGRPRKHPSDAARKLSWWRKERQKGTSPMQDAPQDVHNELYCSFCCVKQLVHHDGQQYTCSWCKRLVQPPADPTACPRSPDRQHN